MDKDAEISDLRPFIAIKFPNRPPPEPGEGPKDIWLFEVSPVLSIPMWIIYLALPLGAVYFGVEIVLSVIERWHQPFGVIKSKDSDIQDPNQPT